MTVSAPPRPALPSRRPSVSAPRPARTGDPVQDPTPEALIEEARRRARRRRLTYSAAAAAVAALAGVAIVAVARTAESRTVSVEPAGRAAGVGGKGSQIVFTLSAGIHGPSELYVVRPDGSGLRRVARFRTMYGAGTPAWSPDGRAIAFVSERDRNEEISIVDADGTGQHSLTGSPLADLGPVWSPDGRTIAFERFAYSHMPDSTVYVMNADGSGERRLAHGGGPLSWSPDGRKLAFADHRRGVAAIMNADGSGQRSLLRNAGPLAWSPDGERLLLTRAHGWDEVERVPMRVDLHVVNADGSGQRRLRRNVGWGTWSPNGREIAFLAYRGPAGIHVMNRDGTGQRRLTGDGGKPVWSPDGATIAFVRDQGDAGPGIYVVSAKGGRERLVTRLATSHDLSLTWLAWSPVTAE